MCSELYNTGISGNDITGTNPFGDSDDEQDVAQSPRWQGGGSNRGMEQGGSSGYRVSPLQRVKNTSGGRTDIPRTTVAQGKTITKVLYTFCVYVCILATFSSVTVCTYCIIHTTLPA